MFQQSAEEEVQLTVLHHWVKHEDIWASKWNVACIKFVCVACYVVKREKSREMCIEN